MHATSDKVNSPFGTALDHIDSKNPNLIERWLPVGHWFKQRGEQGLDPYQKSVDGRISPRIEGRLRDSTPIAGVNFASQDYLSLSSSAQIVAAVSSAAEHYGVHSAGSAALMGNSALSLLLERELEDFLGYKEVTLFPTGWAAGFGIVKLLARPNDHIILDILAHACLQEGADSSKATVHRFPHLSNEAVERRLQRIRHQSPDVGILVVTETLFSMNSDTPNIMGLQAICRQYGATLLVDCAHDLGCIGTNGLGVLELQSMVGQVDVLMGTFSKTFASIGGFVATQHEGFRTALRACCGAQTFTNAMTPIQAAIIREALSIVRSEEGRARRGKLDQNTSYLRTRFEEKHFKVLGSPSAIVPVMVGNGNAARQMTNFLSSNGAIVNLVEAPAVAKNQSRWRIQVMSGHSAAEIDHLVDVSISARSRYSV